MEEKTPINPFIQADTDKTSNLSDIQKKIARFIETEANIKTTKDHGIQPPPVKVFGPEAIKLQQEHEKKQKEFFEKYQITKDEHDFLVDLIFFGEIKIPFNILGHTFLVSDLSPETKRYLAEVGKRVQSHRAITRLKIKAVAECFREIDGVPLDKSFLQKYLWYMQNNLVDLIFKMHLLTETYKMYLYEKLPNFCRTPTSRIRYEICQDMKITINDPIFRNLSEEQIYWHYINSIKSQEIDSKIMDNRIDYITWFINPEISKKLQEKKEMHEDAEKDLVQKYSFMDGILNLIKKDMPGDQLAETMDKLMNHMKNDETGKGEKDPWAIPEEQTLNPEDQFTENINKFVDKLKPPSEGQMGMMGGDPSWYRK